MSFRVSRYKWFKHSIHEITVFFNPNTQTPWCLRNLCQLSISFFYWCHSYHCNIMWCHWWNSCAFVVQLIMIPFCFLIPFVIFKSVFQSHVYVFDRYITFQQFLSNHLFICEISFFMFSCPTAFKPDTSFSGALREWPSNQRSRLGSGTNTISLSRMDYIRVNVYTEFP